MKDFLSGGKKPEPEDKQQRKPSDVEGGMDGARRGSRIDKPKSGGVLGLENESEEGLTVDKQMEAERDADIKYRTCSWQKVLYHSFSRFFLFLPAYQDGGRSVLLCLLAGMRALGSMNLAQVEGCTTGMNDSETLLIALLKAFPLTCSSRGSLDCRVVVL